MKRGSTIAGLLALGLILGGASTWEGSAIVGGADDFPDNGLYGACNSFPHDTTVVVTNLETGKSVTVLITQNVDNPGVFIALSPRAASSLGMQVGTAARVRAVASIGSPESGLPATRTGETSDPDFNPRVYMDRDRAAQAAAAGAAPAARPAAAAASPSAAQVIEEAAGSAPSAPAPAAALAPSPAAAPTAATAAPAAPVSTPAPTGGSASPAVAPEKPKADIYTPPLGQAAPGSPRPTVIAGQLPKPDAAPIPSSDANPAAMSFPASRPQLEGGSIPQPRTAPAPRVALADPEVRGSSITVDALSHPAPSPTAAGVALLDPELGPETLPDEDLPRVAAPSSAEPDTHLAEIDLSTLKIRDNRPESLAIEKPAGAGETAQAAALGEPVAISPAERGGPESGALDRQAAPALVQTTPGLQEPALAAAPGKPGAVIVGLEPTAPRPPSAAAAPTASSSGQAQKPGAGKAPAQVPGTAVVVQGLTKGFYYVQLGVYGTNDALQAAVRGFTAYPLAVEKLEAKGGTVLYRLYVGPLSRDESGVVLIRIRSLGFKDAFLRTGT